MTRRAYQQMIAVGLLWGTIGPAVSLITDRTDMTPVEILLWRLAIALVPLSIFAFVRRRRIATPRVDRWLLSAALGVGLLTAGYQWAYFAAVADIGITIPTLIALGLGPILVATAEAVVFGRRPSVRTIGSLVTAVAGVVVLTVGEPAQVSAAGIALSVASASMYAAAVLSAGPLGRRADVATVNALTVAGALVVIAPLSLAAGGFGAPHDLGGLLGLIWLGTVVSGIAYALYYSAARTLPSTHIVVICLLEPVAAAAIAAVAFGESLTIFTIAGGVLMLGAVVALREEEEPVAALTA